MHSDDDMAAAAAMESLRELLALPPPAQTDSGATPPRSCTHFKDVRCLSILSGFQGRFLQFKTHTADGSAATAAGKLCSRMHAKPCRRPLDPGLVLDSTGAVAGRFRRTSQ